jgi:general secretion pathway protein L
MAAGRALLFYRPGSEKVDWCLLDKDNLREGAFKSSSIDKLADDVYGKDFILAFPGEDVLIRQLSVPRAAGVNPAQLIPNLLEESLVEEIDQLHFVPVRGEDDQYTVCIVNREKLISAIRFFSDAGISLSVIIPEQLLLTVNGDRWKLLIDNNLAMLKTSDNSACKVTLAELELLLPALFREKGEPEAIDLLVNHHAEDMTVLSALTSPVNKTLLGDQPFDWLTQVDAQVFRHNLLNGFQHESLKAKSGFAAYRYAAVFFMLAILVMFTSQFWQYSRFSEQETQLSSSIDTLFRETFPQVKRVIDPVVQARQLMLKQQSTASVGSGFLEIFYLLGNVLKAEKSLLLKDFQYQNARMTFTIAAQSIAKVESLRVQLQRIGTIQTEVLSTRNEENQVIAKMRITAKASS